ncbi:MAG: radical SAM protein [Bacteroidetes bacterium]|nr:MAG: radical SAM protein [Bacteroidota bacterium]
MFKAYQDSLNFIGKLTFAKITNIFKITASYYLSRLTRKAMLWGEPISLSIEPTTSCNLRCPECPSGLRSFTRPTGMLDLTFYNKIIDEQSKSLSYLLLYFQGEPFLHQNFVQMIKYAANKGIYTATSTNAHYFTDDVARETVESGLDRLIISIDGTTQDVYEQYRVGGSLDKVIEGTKKLVYWKKKLKSTTPHLIFQFLVVKPNEHQIDDVEKMAKEIGVDEVKLKTAQLYDYENGNELMPTNEEYSRYKQDDNGTYSLKHKLYNHCWKMWHSSVVTWDGTIVPCCFDKDAAHALGTLKENTFSSIWQSSQYGDFRQSLLKSRSDIDICKNCTEGAKVWS